MKSYEKERVLWSADEQERSCVTEMDGGDDVSEHTIVKHSVRVKRGGVLFRVLALCVNIYCVFDNISIGILFSKPPPCLMFYRFLKTHLF